MVMGAPYPVREASRPRRAALAALGQSDDVRAATWSISASRCRYAAIETVSFALDRTTYEIDLSKKNAAAFRKVLDRDVAAAQRKGAFNASTTHVEGGHERQGQAWLRPHAVANGGGSGYAYVPATDQWRRLADGPGPRHGGVDRHDDHRDDRYGLGRRGWRRLRPVDRSDVRVWTRRERDITTKVPEVATLGEFGVDCVLEVSWSPAPAYPPNFPGGCS